MSHLSLPCHNLEESKSFYSQVMGGKAVQTTTGFVEFRIEDIIIGLPEQAAGWTGPDHEYPHYAFYLDGKNFERMKNLLDQYEIPNYPYRRDNTALIYFRDPSGNLFEMYCPKLEGARSFARGVKQGGSYAIDFAALRYQWNG